ncbi:hypothetical protein FACS1894189_1820 [Planctomycetales bacterium]|nr:hypothetical protein FACS1894189_1820 [Planctomycetales bacterium]
MGIQFKLLLTSITATVFLIAVTVSISTWEFSSYVQESTDEQIQSIGSNIEHDVSMLHDLALEQTLSYSHRADVLAALKNGNREELFKIYDSGKTKRKVDFFTIIDAEGKVFAQSSNRAKFGDVLGETPCVKQAMEQKQGVVNFESTPSILLSIRSAAPIFDTDEKTIVGVVSCGFRVDQEAWVKQLRDRFGVEATTFVGKTRKVTTLINPETNKPAIDTDLNNPVIEKVLFEERKGYHGVASIFGHRYKVSYNPAVDAHGNTIGIIFVGFPVGIQENLIMSNIRNNVIIALIGILIFILLLWIIVSRIVGPIRQMTAVSKDLASGSLDIQLDVQSRDELGVLAKEFRQLASALKAKTDVALTIAGGDLTTWVPLASPHDSLGIAFIKMRYAFYDSLKDLTTLAKAITLGGNQLEQTNERLVANSSESASQLRDISSSIDTLNTQTKSNAENSRNAENIATHAAKNSVEGREKMSRMTEAMTGITKSSEEIKNIIRVIDDIAFQTNLLALNAAVEAARAGQHGKGFAVVAEEVRNLAARSAKAAKETATLIEESIRQVQQGSHVAGETSESLNTIAEQVQEINTIIGQISRDADSQAQQLGEANASIGQVSDMAAQNTQVISESADAVARLTVTAQKLNTVTQHFHTNEGGRVMPPKGGIDNVIVPAHLEHGVLDRREG